MNKGKLILLTGFTLMMSCQYSTETYKEGKVSYDFNCAPCHGPNAEGLGTLYPNLLHTDYIKENRLKISCWIHNGIGPDTMNEKSTRFSDQAMPAVSVLSNIEICNILNYLNARFWNLDIFTLKEIDESLASCKHTKSEMQLQEKVK